MGALALPLRLLFSDPANLLPAISGLLLRLLIITDVDENCPVYHQLPKWPVGGGIGPLQRAPARHQWQSDRGGRGHAQSVQVMPLPLGVEDDANDRPAISVAELHPAAATGWNNG
jgi:hypothetical protein